MATASEKAAARNAAARKKALESHGLPAADDIIMSAAPGRWQQNRTKSASRRGSVLTTDASVAQRMQQLLQNGQSVTALLPTSMSESAANRLRRASVSNKSFEETKSRVAMLLSGLVQEYGISDDEDSESPSPPPQAQSGLLQAVVSGVTSDGQGDLPAAPERVDRAALQLEEVMKVRSSVDGLLKEHVRNVTSRDAVIDNLKEWFEKFGDGGAEAVIDLEFDNELYELYSSLLEDPIDAEKIFDMINVLYRGAEILNRRQPEMGRVITEQQLELKKIIAGKQTELEFLRNALDDRRSWAEKLEKELGMTRGKLSAAEMKLTKMGRLMTKKNEELAQMRRTHLKEMNIVREQLFKLQQAIKQGASETLYKMSTVPMSKIMSLGEGDDPTPVEPDTSIDDSLNRMELEAEVVSLRDQLAARDQIEQAQRRDIESRYKKQVEDLVTANAEAMRKLKQQMDAMAAAHREEMCNLVQKMSSGGEMDAALDESLRAVNAKVAIAHEASDEKLDAISAAMKDAMAREVGDDLDAYLQHRAKKEAAAQAEGGESAKESDAASPQEDDDDEPKGPAGPALMDSLDAALSSKDEEMRDALDDHEGGRAPPEVADDPEERKRRAMLESVHKAMINVALGEFASRASSLREELLAALNEVKERRVADEKRIEELAKEVVRLEAKCGDAARQDLRPILTYAAKRLNAFKGELATARAENGDADIRHVGTGELPMALDKMLKSLDGVRELIYAIPSDARLYEEDALLAEMDVVGSESDHLRAELEAAEAEGGPIERKPISAKKKARPQKRRSNASTSSVRRNMSLPGSVGSSNHSLAGDYDDEDEQYDPRELRSGSQTPSRSDLKASSRSGSMGSLDSLDGPDGDGAGDSADELSRVASAGNVGDAHGGTADGEEDSGKGASSPEKRSRAAGAKKRATFSDDVVIDDGEKPSSRDSAAPGGARRESSQPTPQTTPAAAAKRQSVSKDAGGKPAARTSSRGGAAAAAAAAAAGDEEEDASAPATPTPAARTSSRTRTPVSEAKHGTGAAGAERRSAADARGSSKDAAVGHEKEAGAGGQPSARTPLAKSPSGGAPAGDGAQRTRRPLPVQQPERRSPQPQPMAMATAAPGADLVSVLRSTTGRNSPPGGRSRGATPALEAAFRSVPEVTSASPEDLVAIYREKLRFIGQQLGKGGTNKRTADLAKRMETILSRIAKVTAERQQDSEFERVAAAAEPSRSPSRHGDASSHGGQAALGSMSTNSVGNNSAAAAQILASIALEAQRIGSRVGRKDEDEHSGDEDARVPSRGGVTPSGYTRYDPSLTLLRRRRASGAAIEPISGSRQPLSTSAVSFLSRQEVLKRAISSKWLDKREQIIRERLARLEMVANPPAGGSTQLPLRIAAQKICPLCSSVGPVVPHSHSPTPLASLPPIGDRAATSMGTYGQSPPHSPPDGPYSSPRAGAISALDDHDHVPSADRVARPRTAHGMTALDRERNFQRPPEPAASKDLPPSDGPLPSLIVLPFPEQLPNDDK